MADFKNRRSTKGRIAPRSVRIWAGAYGPVMFSACNARPLAPKVLLDGGDWAVVRARPSYDEMLAGEAIAGWL